METKLFALNSAAFAKFRISFCKTFKSIGSERMCISDKHLLIFFPQQTINYLVQKNQKKSIQTGRHRIISLGYKYLKIYPKIFLLSYQMQHYWIMQNNLFCDLFSDCRLLHDANSFPPLPVFVLSYANPSCDGGGSLAGLGSVQRSVKKTTEKNTEKE